MKKRTQMKRYAEILQVLVKHGLGYWLIRGGILKRDEEDEVALTSQKEVGESLRKALEELGPCFIKFGQMLSTRHDLFSKEVVDELSKLQDAVPPFPIEEVEEVLEESLGKKSEGLFATFEPLPLASGSIAQVHLASLHNGKKVCVKVQRLGIRSLIDRDLAVLASMAKTVEDSTSMSQVFNFPKMVEEFGRTLHLELDFQVELENLQGFANLHLKDKYVRVPKVYPEFSAKKVLVMEYIDAYSIKDLDEAPYPLDRQQIAQRLLYSYANQVFRDGYFHGDPHPGNILVEEGEELVFLDFGIVGNLSDENKYLLLQLFIGISLNSVRMISDAVVKMGVVRSSVNILELERALQSYLDKYLALSLKKVVIAEVINEFFEILLSYKIVIPPDLTTLGKTFIVLEGVIETLDEESNILELATPIAKKLVLRFIEPSYIARYVSPSVFDTANALLDAPTILWTLSENCATTTMLSN